MNYEKKKSIYDKYSTSDYENGIEVVTHHTDVHVVFETTSMSSERYFSSFVIYSIHVGLMHFPKYVHGAHA